MFQGIRELFSKRQEKPVVVGEPRSSRDGGLGQRELQDWSFEISQTPLSGSEQEVFSSDISELGSSLVIWDILNSVLGIGSPNSKLKVLRARRGSELAGVAFFMECRKSGECFFEPPLSTVIDFPGRPVFVWSRYGTALDTNANHGFVAEGIDRQTFKAGAIRALTREYLYGSTVDFSDDIPVPGAVVTRGFDSGYIDVMSFSSIDEYIGRRKKLRTKLNRFRNNGGRMDVIRGALGADDAEACAHVYETMSFQLLTPYQDIFSDLVRTVSQLDHPDIVHFIARINGELVGYHSFVVGSQSIQCLSGGFDRSRESLFNAYDSLIVDSVAFCLEHKIPEIHYGPVLNDTKARMMTRFKTKESRTYVRYGIMKPAISAVMRRSALVSDRIVRYQGIGEPGNPVLSND